MFMEKISKICILFRLPEELQYRVDLVGIQLYIDRAPGSLRLRCDFVL